LQLVAGALHSLQRLRVCCFVGVCVCVGKKEEKKKQTSIHERRTNDDHFCLFLARARALPLYFASAGKFFSDFHAHATILYLLVVVDLFFD
jgi:hypothetical protein